MENDNNEFDELAGYTYLGWISSETPRHVVLNFYTGAEDGSAIHNIFAYLFDAQVAGIDVSCDPFFPALNNIEQQDVSADSDGLNKMVKFCLESGHLSFFYRQVFFHKSTTPLRRLGDQSHD